MKIIYFVQRNTVFYLVVEINKSCVKARLFSYNKTWLANTTIECDC